MTKYLKLTLFTFIIGFLANPGGSRHLFISHAIASSQNDSNDNKKITPETAQSVDAEKLSDLLLQRFNNNSSKNNPKPDAPIVLKLKPLSEGVKKALNAPGNYTIESFSDNGEKQSNELLTITENQTGRKIIIPRSSLADAMGVSPAILRERFKGNSNLQYVSQNGKKISHGAALKGAFANSAVTFPMEALGFYWGVGANHMYNLITKGYENPMAFEQFSEELMDPVSQLGFYAFMGGNRYAMTMLQQGLRHKAFFRSGMGTMLLSFLSMGVGSLSSTVAGDIMSLTKPCTLRYAAKTQEFKERQDMLCQEAYKSIFTSEKALSYVTSVVNIMGAAAGSWIFKLAFLQAPKVALTSVADKTMPILLEKLLIVFNDIRYNPMGSKAMNFVTKPYNLVGGLFLKAFDLVIFLQADELLRPYTNSMMESLLSSGPMLGNSRTILETGLEKYSSTPLGAFDCPNPANYKDSLSSSLSWKGYLPKRNQYLKELRACDPIQQMITFREANQKWRENLLFKFNMAYYTWQQYLGEFSAMASMSLDFYSNFIGFSDAAKKTSADSPSFNPFVHDAPFYGVNYDDLNTDESLISNRHVTNALSASHVLNVLTPSRPSSKDPIEQFKTSIRNDGSQIGKYSQNKFSQILKSVELFKAQQSFASKLDLLKKNEISSLDKIDYSLLVKALNDLNDLYSYLYVVSQSGQNPNLEGGPADLMAQKAKIYVWRLREIRNAIGSPLPLKKGTVFIYAMNEYFKENFEDYRTVFEGKWFRTLVGLGAGEGEGTVADVLTKAAVCGVSDSSEKLNEKRNPWLYKVINEVINVFNFSDNPIRIQDKLHYGGSGMDFLVPKIVATDSSEICNRKDVSIRDNGRSFKLKDGHTYTSYMDYLIKNTDYSKFKTDKQGYLSVADWWETKVYPKVLSTYTDEFNTNYQALLKHELLPVIDKNIITPNQDLNSLSTSLLNAPRDLLNKNPKTLMTTYVEELNVYTQALSRIYTSFINLNRASEEYSEQEIPTSVSLNPVQKQNTIRVFHERLTSIQNSLLKIMRAYKNNNSDIESFYADALVDLRIVSESFLLYRDDVMEAMNKAPSFHALPNDAKMNIISTLTDRIAHDEEFRDFYIDAVKRLESSSEQGRAQIVPFALYASNLSNNKEASENLALAFVATKKIFELFDEALLQTTIFKRATGERFYQESYDQPVPQKTKSIIGK